VERTEYPVSDPLGVLPRQTACICDNPNLTGKHGPEQCQIPITFLPQANVQLHPASECPHDGCIQPHLDPLIVTEPYYGETIVGGVLDPVAEWASEPGQPQPSDRPHMGKPVQVPLTRARLAQLKPNDPITLVHGGRITTHRVTAVDTSRYTVTLGDYDVDQTAEITYSGDIHDAAWNGDD
jgi:hypothetical protein